MTTLSFCGGAHVHVGGLDWISWATAFPKSFVFTGICLSVRLRIKLKLFMDFDEILFVSFL